MSSPGGREVGRVSVRVLPDTAAFRRDLQNELKEVERSVEVNVPVHFDVDPEELRERLATINATITVPVDLELAPGQLAELRSALESIPAVTVPVDLQLDAGQIAQLRAQLESLDGRGINLRVDVDGVALAIAELTALELAVSRLDGREIDIQIDVDAAGALAQIAAVAAALTALNGIRFGGNFTGGGGGGGLGQIGLLAAGLAVIPALAAAAAVAGAGVTAAWGAAATAIGAVPAAVALLGGPIAAVMIGLDGILDAAETVAPEFIKLQTALENTFRRGFIPVFQTLKGIFPTLALGLNGIAGSLARSARMMALFLTSTKGLALLDGMFENVRRAILNITPGLVDITSAFLEMANHSGAFDALTSAVNTFGKAFRGSVTDLVKDGTLTAAFEGLKGTLNELADAFVQLVDNGIRTFASAAPGVNAVLDSLTGFFERFNWNTLGTAVSRVFQGIADAITNVPQGTIDALTVAFQKIGDVFADPAFQADLTNIINNLPALVEGIAGLTREFGTLFSAASELIAPLNTINDTVGNLFKGSEDAGKSVYENFTKPLVEGVQDGIDQVVALLTGDWGDFATSIAGTFQGVDDVVAAAWDGILTTVRAAWELIQATVTAGIEGVAASMSFGWQGLGDTATAAWETIKATVVDAWTTITTTVALSIATVQGLMLTAWTGIQESATVAWQTVSDVITTAWTTITTTVTTGIQTVLTLMSTAWLGIQDAATLAWATVTTVISDAWLTIQTTVTTGIEIVRTLMADAWAGIQAAVVVAWEGIAAPIRAAWVSIQTAVSMGLTFVQDQMTSGWAFVQSITESAWAAIRGVVAAGVSAVQSALASGWASIRSATTTAWNTITAAIRTAWSTIQSVARAGMSALVAAIRAGGAQAVAAFRSLVSQGIAALRTMVSQAAGVGSAIINALVGAISSGAGRVVSALQSLASRALAAAKARLGIASPSKEFFAIGRFLILGLTGGITRNAAQAVQAVAQVADRVVAAAAQIRPPGRAFVGIGQLMGENLALGLESSEKRLIAASRSLVDGMGSEFKQLSAQIPDSGVEDWVSQLDTRVRRSFVDTAPPDTVAAPVTGGGPAVGTIIVNNPTAERASNSIARKLRDLGELGLLPA